MKVVCALLSILALSTACQANPDPQQRITTSWFGLSGLFVMPTARTIGLHNLAVGFNESKHTEFSHGEKFTDRQIRGVATYGVTEWLEAYGEYHNNLYTIPSNAPPDLHNRSFHSFGIKALVRREDPHYWFPAVAVGVRDIAGDISDVGPLKNVYNGTKFFAVASKRMLRNPDTGRFMDVHAGITFDNNATAGMLGFELTLSPNTSLVVEGVWDSPYLDFRNYGHNDLPGRFVFDPGLRIYPELVPGLVLDVGFIGDSEFEFSFGASYVIDL